MFQSSKKLKVRLNACEVCGKIFESRILLSYHRNNAHKEKTLKCKSCPKLFSNSTLLKQHSYTHLPVSERPFKCEKCNATFCQVTLKRKHMKKCNVTIPFVEQKYLENEEADGNVSEVNIEGDLDGDKLQCISLLETELEPGCLVLS